MTPVFVKQPYLKSTKNQGNLTVPEEFIPLKEKDIVVVEQDVIPFELFPDKLNPITDFCKKNYKKIEYIVVGKNQTKPIFLPAQELIHYVVKFEKNTQGTVVFDGALASSEIYVSEGAEAKIVLLQLECKDFNLSALRASVSKNATVNWYVNYINNDQSYSFIQSYLKGNDSKSNIYGVMFSQENELADAFIGNCFDAKNCEGEILIRGVAKDRSKLNIVGEIEITLEGHNTDSYLKKDILMLDKTVVVGAIPSLQVKTNDVKAGHGVSISKLDDEQLFYLTSRGIDENVARQLVLAGFLRDMFAKIEEPEIQEILEKTLSVFN